MPAAARARLAGPLAFAVNAACSAVSAPSTSLKAAALMIHVGPNLRYRRHDRGFVGDVQRPMIEGMDIVRA